MSGGFGSNQDIGFSSHVSTRGVLFLWSAGCYHLTLRLRILGCWGIHQRFYQIISWGSPVTLAGFQQGPDSSYHLV